MSKNQSWDSITLKTYTLIVDICTKREIVSCLENSNMFICSPCTSCLKCINITCKYRIRPRLKSESEPEPIITEYWVTNDERRRLLRMFKD